LHAQLPLPLNENAPADDEGSQQGRAEDDVMNNASLNSADRTTHLKVVAVSLVAGIMVLGIGIAASPTFRDSGLTASRMEATGPIIRAGKPTAVTTATTSTIR
jgi:hypothetical protein